MMCEILQGEVREILRTLKERSVQTVVTSPPYFRLRNYKDDRQIGMEKSPEEYVSNIVEVFREVRRVMRDDGTLWLNLGDSYRASLKSFDLSRPSASLKEKDLIGIPWRVAFALHSLQNGGIEVKRRSESKAEVVPVTGFMEYMEL